MLIELFLILLSLVTYLLIKDRKPNGMPPGPFEIPLVGNVALETRKQLEKYREQYGHIYTTRFGSIRTVTLCDYQLAKEVMASQDFDDRGLLLRQFQIDVNEEGGVLASNGLQWVHDRRFVLRHLRDLGMGKTYLEVAIQEEAQKMVEDIKSLGEKPSKNPRAVRRGVLNIIWQLVASKRYEYTSKEIDRLFEVFEAFRHESFMVFLVIYFPIVKFVPDAIMQLFINKKLLDDFRIEMEKVIGKSIEEHRKTLDPDNSRDLIDDYLIDMEKHKNESDNMYRIQALYEIVNDLFSAGSDTVTFMLRWVIFYMNKYPEATKRCQEEIDRVVGRNNLVSILDKPRLPYVEAYTTEAFRHASMIHMNLQRRAKRDCHIGGYFIPKGTEVVVDNKFIHYDPSFWDEPTAFKPERFIDENGKFQSKLGRTFAFGSGRRQCLGESLARMEFFLFASALLQNFTILVPEGSKLDDIARDAVQIRFPADQPFIYKSRK